MAVGAGDPRWTADNLWYAGTDDMEVYTPEQVGWVGGGMTWARCAGRSGSSAGRECGRLCGHVSTTALQPVGTPCTIKLHF